MGGGLGLVKVIGEGIGPFVIVGENLGHFGVVIEGLWQLAVGRMHQTPGPINETQCVKESIECIFMNNHIHNGGTKQI